MCSLYHLPFDTGIVTGAYKLGVSPFGAIVVFPLSQLPVIPLLI